MEQSFFYNSSSKSLRLLLASSILLVSIALSTTSNAQRPFISTWTTTTYKSITSTSITIPTLGTGYNYSVDWTNDGIIDVTGVTGTISHDYGAKGTYQVAIHGDFPRIYFDPITNEYQLIAIDQWGDIEWTSMESAFSGCANMVYNATDSPDLSKVTSLRSMFSGCTLFNGDISQWNTENVENMSQMFFLATNFNQDLNNWNVQNVTNMSQMFAGAHIFNGDISNWNTNSLTNASRMFSDAFDFNQDIGNWNTHKVKTMNNMFADASSFNQDIGNWDLQSIEFSGLAAMFQGATNFNQNIGNWDVKNVFSTASMFQDATSFNQDIGNWNTENLLDLRCMFNNATSFNQDLSNWNTQKVVGFDCMFQGARSFNQKLDTWNVTNALSMENMLDSSGLSIPNYERTLEGWLRKGTHRNDVIVGVAGLEYSNNITTIRQKFIDDFNWEFVGDFLEGTSPVRNLATESEAFSVFPNPATNHLTLLHNDFTTVTIIDQFGREVLYAEPHATTLDVSELPNGIYYLRGERHNKNETLRFLKN